MRQIGSIENESDGVRFGAFLLTLGIANSVEEATGGWAIWVENDDHLERAIAEFETFKSDPNNPAYAQATTMAKRLRSDNERSEERRRKNFIDVRTHGSQVQQWNVPGTILLITVSLIVGLLTRVYDGPIGPKEPPLVNVLRIAPMVIDGSYYMWDGLAAIRHGEVWRLITPIFLHFGILHLLFNMFWLRDLGSMIESKRGTVFFTILVLVVAVVSNVAQYYHSGPNNGGMSGVVYGLFGYAWMKSRFDPLSGIGMSSQTVSTMLVWLVICMTGWLGHIGNTAHVMGLVVGAGFGYAPQLFRRMKR